MTPMLISPAQAATALIAGCIGLVLLAIAASPIITVANQQLAVLHKKSFHDKLAKQIASMATTLGCLFFTGIAAGSVHIAVQNPEIFQGPFRLPLMVSLGAVTFSFALLMAYTLLWKTMRQSKSLHMLIGLFAAISMISALFLIYGLANSMLREGHVVPAGAGQLEIFTTIYTVSPASAMWPLFVQSLLGGLGASGMFTQCYLLLRRNRDDFGRDYYKFAAPSAAKWALIPTLMQLVPAAWLFFMLQPTLGTPATDNITMWCWLTAAVMPLLASGLWLRVMRSETPMRHKISMIAALPLAMLAAAAQMIAVTYQLGV
ncbi:hypothetical protein N1030_03365 [Desulfovibrio mangrovi]|uniref:hypothetical protein n=1 Tax=Desulfovibrio mangrovi TaxID=2976983 RepID=UPI002244FE4B|nr:hypothetical protein [Desulfovibrio mangrovi]UZP68029.1 hypothetical protein N1030_03365 [Desulfovibrio mangrovi]